MSELYADIVVPLARPAFTFRVGESIRHDISPGRSVKVQLGPNRIYTGIVWRLHDETPPFKTIKTVDEYVPGAPLLCSTVMKFWEWVADYYMCTLGEVMRAAMPSALKPTGLTDGEFDDSTVAPRTVDYVKLHPGISDINALNTACESLRRAPKQYAALVDFISKFPEDELFGGELTRSSVRSDSVTFKNLALKNIFEITTRQLEHGRLPPLPSVLPRLSPVQCRAEAEITGGFADFRPVLLHGVTGSGKTEIYIHLINDVLRKGKNAMYLLPEIAMTSQLVARIRSYFGDRVVVYHSRVNDRRRAENYRRIAASNGGMLVLGVRSAVFMPVPDLGLVVVDEEHDDSYKQNETAPRYNARDCAVVLGRMHGASVLLGSATPSVESYWNASCGKYALATLDERYGDVPMPRVLISDTMTAVKRGERSSHFNKLLEDKIRETLGSGEQVMLFQNRRGFSPYMQCSECGHVVMCRDCNVSLTYHKAESRMRCHYCGRSQPVPAMCPSCGQDSMQLMGFGTEKVEEELARLFPQAVIARLDRDTSRSVQSFNSVIEAFESGKADILVGTQMITKGFDFAGLSLVGILNADNLLNYPDFRASERAFQIISQVAGRAGRREKQGEVVIQTSAPGNVIIRQAASGDYVAMAVMQLAERAEFFYPPYCRLIEITLKHHNEKLVDEAARRANELLRPLFGERLLGPQPPLVNRIKREFMLSFLLKTARDKSFAKTKQVLAAILDKFSGEEKFRNVKIVINVDPV